MATKIEYNDSIVAVVEGGNTATLPVKDRKMSTDILITVPKVKDEDSALPIEVSTEAEMTALLTSGEVGGVYKYIGTTGTYENGALYMLEELEVTNSFTYQLAAVGADGGTYIFEVTDDAGTTSYIKTSKMSSAESIAFTGSSCEVTVKITKNSGAGSAIVTLNGTAVYTQTIASGQYTISGVKAGDIIVVEDNSDCFPAGTPVLMADGTQKLIETVTVGDSVQSFNLETNEYCAAEVEEVVVGYTTRMAMILLSNDTYFAMAEGHPLYTVEGWKSITNKDGLPTLAVGDQVLTAYGYATITSLDVVDTGDAVPVYSLALKKKGSTLQGQQQLQLTTNHIYFAGTIAAITHGGSSAD